MQRVCRNTEQRNKLILMPVYELMGITLISMQAESPCSSDGMRAGQQAAGEAGTTIRPGWESAPSGEDATPII